MGSVVSPEDPALTPDQLKEVDRFWKREAPRLAEAVNELPWAGGAAAREALATTVQDERLRQGFLTKDTFDRVLAWGFGRGSRLQDAEIRAATRKAFALLDRGDEAGAVERLRELSGIGVSRATKILALSDQDNLGIYDSRAAAALASVTDSGKPLVAVPPGMSKQLKGGRAISQDRLAREYPKYTAVLRRLLENAARDPKYGAAFQRVADVERALFASHRGRSSESSPDRLGAAASTTAREPGQVARAAMLGALPGAVADTKALVRGPLSKREFAKRRLREGGLAATANIVGRQAERVGRATTGARAQLQGGARVAVVSMVVGGVSDAGAVIRGELHPRDFVENRLLDAGEAGGARVAGGVVVAGFVAAPFEAPALVIAATVIGAGVAAQRAARPIRRTVSRAQETRRFRRSENPADGEVDSGRGRADFKASVHDVRGDPLHGVGSTAPQHQEANSSPRLTASG